MDDSLPARSPAVTRWLIAVLLLGLMLRLGWSLTRSADPESLATLPDQREYLGCAENLLKEHSLAFFDNRTNALVYAFRMPGYPLFLAACGAKLPIIRAAQSFLDVSTILATFLLARRWLRPGLAVVAAAIVALHPFLIYFTGLILSETLFTAMLAWALVLFTTRPVRREWAIIAWVLGASMLALSIHVRPSAIAMPLVLGIGAVLLNREQADGPRRWRFPIALSAALLTVLALAPWAMRNARVVGAWVWTTTNSGFTLYDGFNPDATGASDQRFVAEMRILRGMSEVDRSKYLNDLAWRYIKENPQRVIDLTARKILRTWTPVPLSKEFSSPLYIAAGALFSVPFDVLILVGLWRTNRSPRRYDTTDTTAMSDTSLHLPRSAVAFLLLPAVYLTIVHALSVGSLRYRIPAEVPLAVIAASAVAIVYRKQQSPDVATDEEQDPAVDEVTTPVSP